MDMREATDMIGTLPHCDQSVLHAPGECRYCDEHPEWQALRVVWGIAFTGHKPSETHAKVSCPSDHVRGFAAAHTWPGNTPSK